MITGKSAHQQVRLLLGDDHPDILAEICNLLEPEFDIAGTASDGVSLIKVAEDLRPDLVVTDIKMPRLSGIEAGRKILELHLSKAVIALSMYKDPQLVRAALDAGISGYVVKENAGEELIEAVRLALIGQVFVSPAIHFHQTD